MDMAAGEGTQARVKSGGNYRFSFKLVTRSAIWSYHTRLPAITSVSHVVFFVFETKIFKTKYKIVCHVFPYVIYKN